MKNNKKRNLLLSLILAAVCIAFLLYVDKFQHYSMLATVLKKGAIYSLVAVSLNLLNGFTGLFSLGQAGFMMIGAYTYSILTIPVADRPDIYQYFDGGIVQFCLPMIVGLILAGVVPAIFAYLIGLPVGLILRMTDRDGIHPIGWLNRTLGIIVNALRSIPFIILMVAMLPVAKAIVGTSLGNRAVIVTLVIAAAPYVARMVESAAKEVDAGVIEAALSMGASTLRIIWKVIIPEAKPALITGAVISTVTILGYSAMAGTIGGGGLGQIAITYGYQKYDDQIVWLCVALTIIIVQILQEFGMYIARRTDRRSRT